MKQAILGHIPQVTLVDACGSTEGALIGSMICRSGMTLSTDRFTPAPGVRILRADGTDVAAGSAEIGMFCVPTVARGYRNDPERTAAAFRTLGGRRYVSTGDLGRWNADGTVTLIGRGTSVINTGGEKVFPEEVEKVIRMLPSVDDCVVIGLPDERFGQRVAAVVQPSGAGLESRNGHRGGTRAARRSQSAEGRADSAGTAGAQRESAVRRGAAAFYGRPGAGRRGRSAPLTMSAALASIPASCLASSGVSPISR